MNGEERGRELIRENSPSFDRRMEAGVVGSGKRKRTERACPLRCVSLEVVVTVITSDPP